MNIVKVLVATLLVTICTSPAPSSAAGAKVSLYGKNTAIAGVTTQVTVHVTPARRGTGVALFSGTSAIRSAVTNAAGNITFTFKLAKNTTLTAKLTASPWVKSASLKVSVYHNTRLFVDWPNYTISCTDESLDAYILPASAGRKVAMQYFNNGKWVNEDTAVTDADGYVHLNFGDNANTTPAGQTMTAKERIVVAAKGRYLATSDSATLEYEGCGSGSGSGGSGSVSASHSGDGLVGSEESFSWDLTDSDPTLWDAEAATVAIEVCDMDADNCDASDPDMPTIYDDFVTVYGDDSGSFSWYPDYEGNFLVRIGLWDNGELLDYSDGEYSITY